MSPFRKEKNCRKKRDILPTAILLAVLMSPTGIAAAQTPSELPALEGEEFSRALAINAIGEAVGASGPHPVLWDRSGSVILLPVPEGTVASQASGINSQGFIAGVVRDEEGSTRALVWNTRLVPKILQPLAGGTDSWANGINNKGEVIGTSSGGPKGTKAVIWNRKGVPRTLPPVEGGTNSRGIALNNKGEAVGTSDIWGATAWSRAGEPRPLPLEDELFPSQASAINKSGVIVGHNFPNVLRWPPAGGFELFARDGEAYGINGVGRVVGVVGDVDEFLEPFDAALWSPKGTLTVLEALEGDTDSIANAINANGVIVGESHLKEDEFSTVSVRAVIWR